MVEKISLSGVSNTEWLRLRKSGIGGSDAGAVCGYHKRKDLKDTLREVLQEELKHVSVPQDVMDDERQDLAMDAGVLDFLQALQNE